MITLSRTLFSELEAQALEAYPHECCGALLGNVTNDTKHCVELRRIDNSSTENKQRRFAITAQDYSAVEAYAKKVDRTLLGFYHSHPDHPAQPSDTDLKYAWPFFSYIILSVREQGTEEAHSFVLEPETNRFASEEFSIE